MGVGDERLEEAGLRGELEEQEQRGAAQRGAPDDVGCEQELGGFGRGSVGLLGEAEEEALSKGEGRGVRRGVVGGERGGGVDGGDDDAVASGGLAADVEETGLVVDDDDSVSVRVEILIQHSKHLMTK